MTYLRMLAAISTVAIICVSVPIFLILIFQTSKRYDFDSVWACVSHAATCHDNHQVGFAQRHLLFCLIMHLNESFNFQKMFGSFFYFTAAKFASSVQRWTQRSWAESSNCSFASDGRTPGFDVVNNEQFVERAYIILKRTHRKWNSPRGCYIS